MSEYYLPFKKELYEKCQNDINGHYKELEAYIRPRNLLESSEYHNAFKEKLETYTIKVMIDDETMTLRGHFIRSATGGIYCELNEEDFPKGCSGCIGSGNFINQPDISPYNLAIINQINMFLGMLERQFDDLHDIYSFEDKEELVRRFPIVRVLPRFEGLQEGKISICKVKYENVAGGIFYTETLMNEVDFLTNDPSRQPEDKSSEYNQKQVWELDSFDADGYIEFEYKFCKEEDTILS